MDKRCKPVFVNDRWMIHRTKDDMGNWDWCRDCDTRTAPRLNRMNRLVRAPWHFKINEPNPGKPS